METAFCAQDHVGHDRGLLRDHLHTLGLYGLAAVLSGARTPHECGEGRVCRRDSIFLRMAGSHNWRLALRLSHAEGMGTDRRPEAPDLIRSRRYCALYRGYGIGGIQYNRTYTDLGFPVSHL